MAEGQRARFVRHDGIAKDLREAQAGIWGRQPMKKTLLAAIAALVLLLGSIGPAGAVTDGEVDHTDYYDMVGIMVAYDEADQPMWRCSGTLLSPTLFLTAGHCTYGATWVGVWFDPDLTRDEEYPWSGYDVTGVPYTMEGYTESSWVYYDVGVVVLNSAYETPSGNYGYLPEYAGYLDSLATQRGQQDMTFVAVGYGLQASFPTAAEHKNQAERIRMISTPNLIQINGGLVGDYSLLLSNNANTGGTCFGDSGGPNFYGEGFMVAGVTSFGLNGNCAGTGGVFRMDQQRVLDWLYGNFGEYLP
jgi:secreted trypsin-like serine protease